jgi:uncharacterized protein (DUF2164 family)
MENKNDYIGRTILKLRRKYSKDELVAALNKLLIEKDIEIGTLKAEIDFLTHKLNNEIDEKKVSYDAKVLAKADALREDVLMQNRKLREINNDYKNRINTLIAQNVSLQRRIESNNG